MMGCSRISLLLILLSYAHQASAFDHVLPPSPSPLPSLGSQNAPSPLARLTCDNAANKCDFHNFTLTSCVPFLANGSQASYVVVLNGGESSLQLNILVLPANMTLEGLPISGHQVEKVNLPPYIEGDSWILLNVGNEECTIHLGDLLPQGLDTTYITATNAIYLFFGAALFIGGSWACCNLVKRRNHLELNGVSYKELEMEPRDFVGGWDQNWDEEWDDEEKAVKSPGTVRTRKGSENGGS